MILFNSFLHRYQLADIIRRWLVDRLEDDDVRRVKELVNFNCHLARQVMRDVAEDIFSHTADGPIQSMPASTKGVLKDFLVDHPPFRTPRIDELIKRYHKYPQDFYRETPFEGHIYYKMSSDRDVYLGSTRRKRFKRIAEKSSRRIIDYVFQQIKVEAETLALERARRLGVPINKLMTPIEEQDQEFLRAERRVIKRIRLGQFTDGMPYLDINDVVGVKVQCEDHNIQRLTALLDSHPRMDIVECELHSGSYNAVNITLRYRIDKDALLREPLPAPAIDRFNFMGLDRSQVDDSYREFVTSGEDDVLLEVIAADYEEILESEVGRSMHEERVWSQRSHQQYRAPLARNIAALLEYMMALRCYPGDAISDIPIKLWIKYMPEYFELVMRNVYNTFSE